MKIVREQSPLKRTRRPNPEVYTRAQSSYSRSPRPAPCAAALELTDLRSQPLKRAGRSQTRTERHTFPTCLVEGAAPISKGWFAQSRNRSGRPAATNPSEPGTFKRRTIGGPAPISQTMVCSESKSLRTVDRYQPLGNPTHFKRRTIVIILWWPPLSCTSPLLPFHRALRVFKTRVLKT